MDWLLPSPAAESRGATDPGLPRRVLRHVLRTGEISVGSQVLIAGCGRGGLTRFFDELSIDVSGVDESTAEIAAARAAAGHLTYACSPLAGRSPFPERSFDVILVRELREYRGDLLSHTAFLATAHLLAMLRPAGRLIVLNRVDPAWSNPAVGHLPGCYQQHLTHFPGALEVSSLVDSLLAATTWKWMLGRQPRAGFVFARLAVAPDVCGVLEWEAIADRAARRWRQPCCAWGASANDIPTPVRISA